MKKDEDMKYFKSYLKGNIEAFNTLYNKYKNKIHYYIYTIIKDNQKAEDLMQETFIYLINSDINKAYTFKYHLYLIAKSRALNYLKLEKRRNEINELYINNNIDKYEKDVQELIEMNETKKELLNAINKLDKKYKEALYLTCIEELSYEEVSNILKESKSNIKNLVHRGKKKVKVLLNNNSSNIKKIRKTLILFLIATIFITGTTIAFVKIYNNYHNNYFKIEKAINTDKDFIYAKGFYYKNITNYKDYLEVKDFLPNIIDVDENSFNEKFLMIITSDDTDKQGLEFDEYVINESKINIFLKPNLEKSVEQATGISVLIPNEYINFIVNIEKISINYEMKDYVPIKDLPNDYNVDQATKDNCLVIDVCNNTTINEYILNEFLQKVEKKEKAEIRIYEKIDDINNQYTKSIIISDIIYLPNEKFIISHDYTRSPQANQSYQTDEIYTNTIRIGGGRTEKNIITTYYIEDNRDMFMFATYKNI